MTIEEQLTDALHTAHARKDFVCFDDMDKLSLTGPIADERKGYISVKELEPTIGVIKEAISRLVRSTYTGPVLLQSELTRLEALVKEAK